MKTSLEKEINTYRELLEGTTNREGLKQIVDHVVEEARRMEAERATGSGVAGSCNSYIVLLSLQNHRRPVTGETLISLVTL